MDVSGWLIHRTYRTLVAIICFVALGIFSGYGMASATGTFVPAYPLPAAGQAVALGMQTAQEIRPAQYDEGAWQYSLFDSYGGGVLVPSYSQAGAYVIAGTGGHGAPEHSGGAAFDFTTGTWQLLPDASGTPAHVQAYGSAETNGAPEYEIALSPAAPNAVPSPAHPYMNLMPLPTGLGGGAARFGGVCDPVRAMRGVGDQHARAPV